MREKDTRTAMLIGEDGVDRLRRARVVIFGIGGVGGYVAEALARAGVGTLTLIDMDTVSESNLNRQIIATRHTVGMAKTDAFKERIESIDPEIEVNTLRAFIEPESLDELALESYDYAVDAIDTVKTKIALAEKCENIGTPLISSMGTGNKLDPTKFEVCDIYKTSVCPLARAMRSELKRRGVKALKVVYSREEPREPLYLAKDGKRTVGSISFVPSAAGLVIAAEVVKDLIKKA